MKKFQSSRIFTFLLLTLPAFAISQIQTRKISFPAGSNSTTIKSTIKGEQTIDYKVNAREGQEMQVSLKTSNNANYFNILAPGSVDEAIFIGSNESTNSFGGTLSVSGDYTIRVYLYRSAARRNETAGFTLTVKLGGGQSSGETDAKVPGTAYHATGKVRSSFGNETRGSVMSTFGVIRKSQNNAEIHVTYPKAMKRVLLFNNGEWTSPEAQSVNVNKSGDVWEITVNDYEHYFIPAEVITGG